MQGLNEFLMAGGVVAFPTDTVWGLGALPTAAGMDALYEIKRRPREKQFIIMSDSIEHFPQLSPRARELAAKYWPGALTIIDGGTGYRIPESCVVRDLCAAVSGHCLATTSANISGMPPCSSADEIRATFPNVRVIEPLPSTIVRVTGDEIEILRQGGVVL